MDMRPITLRLIDRDDKVVDTLTVPPRLEGQEPRIWGWCGRRFREDVTGFYEDAAVEIVEDMKGDAA